MKRNTTFVETVYRIVTSVLKVNVKNLFRLFTFFIPSLAKYKSLSKEKVKFKDWYPILDERFKHEAPSHYFYQDVWALRRVYQTKPTKHLDIGSRMDTVAHMSIFTDVTFIDFRELKTQLPNFQVKQADILDLPYPDNSLASISCLHVAEHIGLGRYGDKLNPQGTKEAARELSRVLAKKGNLFFSLPIGYERVYFNAHRIHDPHTIIDYFSDLRLVEFSAISDKDEYIENADINSFLDSKYACGLFWFTKD